MRQLDMLAADGRRQAKSSGDVSDRLLLKVSARAACIAT